MSTDHRDRLIDALHRLAGASPETEDKRLAEALAAAEAYSGRVPLTIGEIRDRIAFVHDMPPVSMRLFIAHLAGYAPGLFDEVAGWTAGDGIENAPEDPAAKLAEIRLVLAAFDWETDDRQYALERIDEIANREQERAKDQRSGTCAACGHTAHPETPLECGWCPEGYCEERAATRLLRELRDRTGTGEPS